MKKIKIFSFLAFLTAFIGQFAYGGMYIPTTLLDKDGNQKVIVEGALHNAPCDMPSPQKPSGFLNSLKAMGDVVWGVSSKPEYVPSKDAGTLQRQEPSFDDLAPQAWKNLSEQKKDVIKKTALTVASTAVGGGVVAAAGVTAVVGTAVAVPVGVGVAYYGGGEIINVAKNIYNPEYFVQRRKDIDNAFAQIDEFSGNRLSRFSGNYPEEPIAPSDPEEIYLFDATNNTYYTKGHEKYAEYAQSENYIKMTAQEMYDSQVAIYNEQNEAIVREVNRPVDAVLSAPSNVAQSLTKVGDKMGQQIKLGIDEAAAGIQTNGPKYLNKASEVGDKMRQQVNLGIDELNVSLPKMGKTVVALPGTTKKTIEKKVDQLQEVMRDIRTELRDSISNVGSVASGQSYEVNDYDYDGKLIPGEPYKDQNSRLIIRPPKIAYKKKVDADTGIKLRNDRGFSIPEKRVNPETGVEEDDLDNVGNVIPGEPLRNSDGSFLMRPAKIMYKKKIDSDGIKIRDSKGRSMPQKRINPGLLLNAKKVFEKHALKYSLVGGALLLTLAGSYFSLKHGINVAARYVDRKLIKTPELISEKVMRTRLSKAWAKIVGKPTPIPMVVAPDIAEKMQILTKTVCMAHKQIASGNPLTRYPIVLLHGRPGTGKTMFAEKLARESDLNYLKISGPSVTQFAGGKGVTQLKEIFEWANKQKNGCLIFIDEAEGFLLERSLMKNPDSETAHNLQEFLNQVQKASNKIMLVFATNRPELIDSAVRDRVTDSVHVPLPGEEERLALIKMYYTKYIADKKYNSASFIAAAEKNFNEEVMAQLTKNTDGASARSLENIIIKIKMLADISDEGYITEGIVEKARQFMMIKEKEIAENYQAAAAA